MWSFFQYLLKPAPPTITFIGARFPADGSTPYLVPLTTTSDHPGPDCFLSRLPDLRAFWKVSRGWEYRDLEQMTFKDQPNEAWNGVYLKWFSFALDDLPENRSVPLIFCRAYRLAAGDVFIVKLAPQECDEHGWTVYEDFPPEFLEYCLARNRVEIESYVRLRDEMVAQKAIWPGTWAQDNRSEWLDAIYRERRGETGPDLSGRATRVLPAEMKN